MLQPDKGAAVPKFGDWDVSNPASADGYTHIFNKVREERQGGAGHAPGTPNERPHVIHNQNNSGKTQVCRQFLVNSVLKIKPEIELMRLLSHGSIPYELTYLLLRREARYIILLLFVS
jgi:hypothetical protein